MKKLFKLLIIVIWFISFSGSEKSEWYLKIYDNNNTIILVPRDQYLELYSLFYPDYEIKSKKEQIFKRAYIHVKTNEYESWELQPFNKTKIDSLIWN